MRPMSPAALSTGIPTRIPLSDPWLISTVAEKLDGASPMTCAETELMPASVGRPFRARSSCDSRTDAAAATAAPSCWATFSRSSRFSSISASYSPTALQTSPIGRVTTRITRSTGLNNPDAIPRTVDAHRPPPISSVITNTVASASNTTARRRRCDRTAIPRYSIMCWLDMLFRAARLSRVAPAPSTTE